MKGSSVVFYFLIIVFFFNCREQERTVEIKSHSDKGQQVEKTSFSIENKKDFSIIKSGNNNYVLYKKEKPQLGTDYIYFKIPVKRVVVLSSSHIGYIRLLDEISTVVGISKMDYFQQPVKEAFKREVLEIGDLGSLQYEKLVRLDPDIVFLYSMDRLASSYTKKLDELKIPYVFVQEFQESHPLSRASWLQFFAEFYDKGEHAMYHLEKIEQNYNFIRDHEITDSISIFSGISFQDAWYTPGGNSYQAKLFEDAGYKYIYSEDYSKGSISVHFEELLDKALEADYWINVGQMTSLDQIATMNVNYTLFEAYKKKKVYNYRSLEQDSSIYSYWVDGAVRPDLVLKDLVNIRTNKDSLSFYFNLSGK